MLNTEYVSTSCFIHFIPHIYVYINILNIVFSYVSYFSTYWLESNIIKQLEIWVSLPWSSLSRKMSVFYHNHLGWSRNNTQRILPSHLKISTESYMFPFHNLCRQSWHFLPVPLQVPSMGREKGVGCSDPGWPFFSLPCHFWCASWQEHWSKNTGNM